jgi:hypothetical protein
MGGIPYVLFWFALVFAADLVALMLISNHRSR